nr:hypothetical protein CFP56_12246 [Quercus suber]
MTDMDVAFGKGSTKQLNGSPHFSNCRLPQPHDPISTESAHGGDVHRPRSVAIGEESQQPVIDPSPLELTPSRLCLFWHAPQTVVQVIARYSIDDASDIYRYNKHATETCTPAATLNPDKDARWTVSELRFTSTRYHVDLCGSWICPTDIMLLRKSPERFLQQRFGEIVTQ